MALASGPSSATDSDNLSLASAESTIQQESIMAEKLPTPKKAYTKIGDPALLDRIDKLFTCNVGEYIDLPQLVVVGDQSSGKSSVLEGLTRLPFPRDSGLCTKFATQITFRKTASSSISVSIIPDVNGSPEYQDRISRWRKTDITQLNGQAFVEIMKEVRISCFATSSLLVLTRCIGSHGHGTHERQGTVEPDKDVLE